MNKNIKRIITYSLALSLLSIHTMSFAAIVSDNDGSAFVTKSEFESLKKDFNSQISNYNSSIDSKIDGAISAYLAGITLSQKPEISWNTLTEKLGGTPLHFKNKFKTITTTEITPEVNISITRDLCIKGEWGITCARRFFENSWNYNPSAPNDHAQSYVKQSVWILAIGGTNAGNYIEGDITRRLAEWRTPDTDHYQEDGVLQQYQYDLVGPSPRNFSNALARCVWTKKPNIQASVIESSDGSGTAWIYHKAVNGNKYLREYANVWPILNLDVWRHDYKDFQFSTYDNFTSLYMQDNGRAITDATIETTATEHHTYGSWTEGTKYEGESENSGTFISGSVIQMKANDGVDYSIYQYGSDLANNIICLQDTAAPKAETSTSEYLAENMSWTGDYFNEFGKRKQTNQINDLKLTYTKLKQEVEQIDPSTIVNEYISNIVGENVYLGGGAPLLYTYDDGQEIKLKIMFDSTGDAGDTVHYCITNKQFVKGAAPSDATIISEGNATVGTEVEVNLSSGSKTQYWINMYSNTDEKDCTISSIKLSVK